MKEIVREDQTFIREEHGVAEGIELFADQPYKVEIIEGVSRPHGPANDDDSAEGVGGNTVSTYRNTPGFVDLCRGPHVPSTGKLGPLQADEGGGRLLAGRRAAAPASAHLRDGMGIQGRARGPPAPFGGGREDGITGASGPSSTCSTSRPRSAGVCRCSTPRGHWSAS